MSQDDDVEVKNEMRESLDDLFCEIWERESKPELRFAVAGAGTVVQTQDVHGKRWEVNNFSNTVWEASIWMHHFFQDERCFPVGWFRGRRVLELGAGTGLIGLTLALLGAEVTMTDLPEALPILRHNTGATCGPAFGNVNHGDDDQARRPCLRTSLLTGVNGKRPSIRQLCWGNSVEAGEVAAAAAAAAGDEVSEWRGFDLIVGADVIYNEPTFPALVSTLSDRRLCSDTTLVYLATMLRGGRHEGLLDQLNETFHVRALNPMNADDLRARVDDGRDWTSHEWRRANMRHERTKTEPASISRSAGDSGNCSQSRHAMDVTGNVSSCLHRERDSSAEHEATACGTAVATADPGPVEGATMSARGEGRLKGGVSSGTIAKLDGEDRNWKWSYNDDGLRNMLAYVARRRRETEIGGEDLEA